LDLIKASGCAIAAPSANPFGYVSPTEAEHVAEQLSESIDLILDGGPCTVGVESTILSLAGTRPAVLRFGGVPVEALTRLIGDVDVATGNSERPEAPGQMRRHYATRTPLRVLGEHEQLMEPAPGERVGLLTFLSREPGGFSSVEVLSATGSLREAAANLFSALRRLDSLGLDRLVACPVPETGLGKAIMDRLRRCAAGE